MKKLLSFFLTFAVVLGVVQYRDDLGQAFSSPTNSSELRVTDRGLLNVGRAPFAIAHRRYQCDDFLKSVDRLQVLNIAFLYHTFGHNYDCIKTLMQDPRLSKLEIHLINEPCHRNRRCEKHEFLASVSSPQKYDQLLRARDAKLKARFDKYVERLQALLAGYLQPTTQCYISPGLESNVGDRAAKVLVRWAREAFPQCKIVWNPLKPKGPARAVGADLVEGHGPAPKLSGPCIANLDGTDVNFPERTSTMVKTHVEGQPKNWVNSGAALQSYLNEYGNKCELAFVWTVEDNCNNSGDTSGFKPPLTRQCRVGKVNQLAAKEVKTAHVNGRREPRNLEYTEEDMRSFAGCSVVRENWNDGDKRGRLLKQSEFSDRGGVIITSTDLNGSRSIEIQARGRRVDSYTRNGQYTHDGGRRDLWRSRTSPTKYPFKVAVRIRDRSGKLICYKIPNPTIRQD